MGKIKLARRVYEYPELKHQDYFKKVIRNVLKEELGDKLDYSIEAIDFNENQRIVIDLTGADEEFIKSSLYEHYGRVKTLDDLRIGQEYVGTLKLVNKVRFGCFVDIGIEEADGAEIDVLLRKDTLREQLCAGERWKMDQLAYRYGNLIDHLPVHIELTEMDIDNRKLEGRLSLREIDRIGEWIMQGYDLLFATGAARTRLKRELTKKGLYPNLIRIDRLGFEEVVVLFEKGTSAPGIVPMIGHELPNMRFSILIPEKLQKYW